MFGSIIQFAWKRRKERDAENAFRGDIYFLDSDKGQAYGKDGKKWHTLNWNDKTFL